MSKPIAQTSLATLLFSGCLAAIPAHATPQNYELDGQHTHIIWQVDRFGFTKTIGSFTKISGNLILDEDAPHNSSVQAEISLSGLRSDLAEREDIIRGKYWLSADKHPRIEFASQSVTLDPRQDCENKCAIIKGEMTLKGVSAPLILKVQLNKMGNDPVTKKKAIGFTATGVFMRSDFKIMTAIGPVGNEVTFQIEALAIEKD